MVHLHAALAHIIAEACVSAVLFTDDAGYLELLLDFPIDIVPHLCP